MQRKEKKTHLIQPHDNGVYNTYVHIWSFCLYFHVYILCTVQFVAK